MPQTQTSWPFDPVAWQRDTKLLSPATRGIYFEFLCEMELHSQCLITGTRDELAQLGRCTVGQIELSIEELKRRRTLDISERNACVTLINRRRQREEKARRNGHERVQRHRHGGDCNATVTPGVTALIAKPASKLDRSPLSALSVDDQAEQAIKTDKAMEALEKGGPGEKTNAVGEVAPTPRRSAQFQAPPRGASSPRRSLPALARAIAQRMEDCLGHQWPNDAGKWVNRVKTDPHKTERVAAELACAITESRIATTPAQYAEQIWQEFK